MKISITESPRDAMQGLHNFIPTEVKADYINALLKVGFDVLDFGSFVSPKAIPQLSDTAEVLERLDLSETDTKLLAIVGNLKGAEQSGLYKQISLIGYPHSTSNHFLELNINSNIKKSRETILELIEIADKSKQEMVIYLSMALGNPYGEVWNMAQVEEEVEWLHNTGVRRVAVSDTIGIGSAETISELFGKLVPAYPEMTFGLHLHTTLENWRAKIEGAFMNGCRSFDGVINGLGGCPMAGHEMVGNIYTGLLLEYFQDKNVELNINKQAFEQAMEKALSTFSFAQNGLDKEVV